MSAEEGRRASAGEAPPTTSARLQMLGRQLLARLQMLVRNVRLYQPDNAIFQKPLQETVTCINEILAAEGRLELTLAKESFYLNGNLLRLDARSLASLQGLREEMERCNVGGLFLEQPINTQEIINFIYIFSKDNTEPAGECGVSARKLAALKLRRFEKIQEILRADSKQESRPEQASTHLDRKRYAVVVYARAVHFLRSFIQGLVGEGPLIAPSRANPILQDLVDVCFEHHNQFLGLVTAAQGTEHLVHHSVAVCMLSVVFGVEAGMSKAQLRGLATAALFHDIGRIGLPENLLHGGKPSDQRQAQQLQAVPRESVRLLLRFGTVSPESTMTLVTAREVGVPFGKAIKDLSGRATLVEKTAELSPYTKIIAMADVFHTLTATHGMGADTAFAMMNGELRHRFDPLYLKCFGRMVSAIVQRRFSEEGQKLEIF